MIAVTGATGWIGRAVVARLLDAGEPFAAFASSPREVLLDDGRLFTVRPLEDLPRTEHDRLVHLAYVTREHVETLGHDAYVAANVAITSTVLDAIERFGPAVAFASSGAAAAGRPLASDPYGALKRLDEHALRDAAPSCVVARVFNVAGPHITKPDGFAIGDLIAQAQRTGKMTVTAHHRVVRSYVDVDDLAALVLAQLGAGEDAMYDTAGPEEVEVGDLALRVARMLGLFEDSVRRERDATLPEDRYVGEPDAFVEACVRHAIVPRDLDAVIARTARYLLRRPDRPGETRSGYGPHSSRRS